MVTGYSSYRVEVKNVKFIADDGRICPRTAIITLFDHDNVQVGSELFGAIEIAEVYSMIKEGSDLNLDNFYISDFSLANYRRHNNLEKKDFVEIHNFSARNAFFESKVATDFSHSAFSVGKKPNALFRLAQGAQPFTHLGNRGARHTCSGAQLLQILRSHWCLSRWGNSG